MSMPLWWWDLTKEQKARRMASALFITPTIMLFPMWLGLFVDPSALIELWDFYLLFFGLPYAAAASFWIYAGRLRRASRAASVPQVAETRPA
jgi:hypothetical protein